MTEQVKKKIVIGHTGRGKITLDVELKENEKGVVLSISGSVGIKEGGQINDTLRQLIKDDGIRYDDEVAFIKDYTKDYTPTSMVHAKLLKLLEIWDRWHLNDLNAGCEHQRALIPKIKAEKGDKFFNASNYDEIIKLPEFGKCPDCGYKYGTAWKFEELPEEVITFIRNFPDVEINEADYKRMKEESDKQITTDEEKESEKIIKEIQKPESKNIKLLRVETAFIPHPYMVGTCHVEKSPGYILDIERAERDGCSCEICKERVNRGRQDKVLTYKEHKQPKTLFVAIPNNTPEALNSNEELRNYLQSIKPQLEKFNIEGIAFERL